ALLLSIFAWLLVRGRVRAVQAAEQLNRELVERKRAEEDLRLAATVVKTVEEAVLVTDANNLIVSVNPAFTAITGYLPEDVIGKNPRILSSGKHSTEFFKELWKTLLATGSWHGEIWDRRKNGALYVKWLSIRLVRDEHDRLTHYVAVFSDISDRKSAEERMQHLAHYDVLTDLPNRALFSDRLQQGIAQAKRDKTRMALMFLDLDKFKPINDKLGHAVGDLLLKEVAKRLLNCVRESDTVSRIGGDEFVVLLPTIEAELDAMLVADKILHSLDQPFDLAGHSMDISVSIGLVVYPEHGSDERAITKNADIAMYYAKASGGNNAKLFRADMSATGAYCTLDSEKI
ncbi:MAG: diguanylate cyclase, partial [Gallionella sp.]